MGRGCSADSGGSRWGGGRKARQHRSRDPGREDVEVPAGLWCHPSRAWAGMGFLWAPARVGFQRHPQPPGPLHPPPRSALSRPPPPAPVQPGQAQGKGGHSRAPDPGSTPPRGPREGRGPECWPGGATCVPGCEPPARSRPLPLPRAPATEARSRHSPRASCRARGGGRAGGRSAGLRLLLLRRWRRTEIALGSRAGTRHALPTSESSPGCGWLAGWLAGVARPPPQRLPLLRPPERAGPDSHEAAVAGTGCCAREKDERARRGEGPAPARPPVPTTLPRTGLRRSHEGRVEISTRGVRCGQEGSPLLSQPRPPPHTAFPPGSSGAGSDLEKRPG